jgi:hypothetical protein
MAVSHKAMEVDTMNVDQHKVADHSAVRVVPSPEPRPAPPKPKQDPPPPEPTVSPPIQEPVQPKPVFTQPRK